MTDIVIVHAGESPPETWDASLFLAGPTPRSADVPSWRPAALRELVWEGPGRLAVFVPEPRDGSVWPDCTSQITWELRWGDRCDVVLFWIPRGPGMPALTTNDEFGRWKDSGRVVLGTPPGAEHVRYQREYAATHGIPVSDTLPDTVASALSLLAPGATRSGGERHVPLLLWRTPSFQSWLGRLREAGDELRSGKLEWTWRIGGTPFLWAFHTQVFVAAEDRVKSNEVVLSRPDIASVVAYRKASVPADTEVVLVREFRSPGGFVHELPGGSHPTPMPMLELAAEELAEETGVRVSPDRLRAHHDRPLAASFSAHRQHVFSVELTADEMTQLRPAGNHEESERTYPEVHRLGDLLKSGDADWTTLGALAEVLFS